jgi:hypothetical protein
VLDAKTGQELLAVKGHGLYENGVAFSPDGSRLATGGPDGFWAACCTASIAFSSRELVVRARFLGVLSIDPNVTHTAGVFRVTHTFDGTPFSPQEVNRFFGIAPA